jgi:hypothetical protein
MLVAYDDSLSAPLNGSKTICSLIFYVKGTTSQKLSVTASDIILSSNGADIAVSNATCTRTIYAPLSKNAYLSSLKVTNAKISPSFSKTKTKYYTTVSHSTTKLKISAKAAVSGAKIKITNNYLKAGRTTYVKITVTAPAGNTKTYTIAAKRR